MTVTIALHWPERLRLFLAQWFPRASSSAPAQTGVASDGGITFERQIAEIMSNPRTQRAYERAAQIKGAWRKLVETRIDSKITPEQMAKRMGVKKAIVEDFEDAGSYVASLDTWSRYAEALGFTITFGLKPIEDEMARAEAA